ncbi:glycosyltransferase family 2 protein [Gelidibacter salicanalis]|uniref:Glycosyltransferase n=1 Tax=Gelidibacter salicanalis TaxID=291193 RepID=A0A934KJY9_9FLAO|nr:glycosyltransferase family 2 protein [Gelidibacter salicanalis]MBJ7879169.1 glycosyltransferase [Gelidibacter salicanalis]
MISIIIPSFNAESTIKKTILSITDQSVDKVQYEIIVIDGQSTDSTMDVLKAYKDEIDVLVSEPDAGIYDAMNKGIKVAKGEWIYFLGADDVLYNTSVLSEVSEKLNTTNADIIYGDVVKTPSQTVYDGKFNAYKMVFKNICHQAIFYHKSVFANHGTYIADYTINADWEFNFKTMLSGVRFQYIPLTVAYFNENGASGTRQDIAYEIRRKEFFGQLPLWAKFCFKFRKTFWMKWYSKNFLNFEYA